MKKEELEKKYVGKRIVIIHLEGEPDKINDYYAGRKGTVDHVDDAGQLHGSWGGLAILPDHDDFDIIG